MSPGQLQQSLIGYILKWIDKYGFPTVAIVLLYFDFIQPLKEERKEMQVILSQIIATQAKVTEQIVENQKITISNQHQIMSNQKDIMNSSRTMIRMLEEHNLKVHVSPEEREEELRKYLDKNECMLDPESQLEIREHLNLTESPEILDLSKVH